MELINIHCNYRFDKSILKLIGGYGKSNPNIIELYNGMDGFIKRYNIAKKLLLTGYWEIYKVNLYGEPTKIRLKNPITDYPNTDNSSNENIINHL